MPQLGEIKKGSKTKPKQIWTACEDCGKERWVDFRKGKPLFMRCWACYLRGFADNPTIGKRLIPCVDCGKMRRGYFINGEPKSLRCQSCAIKKAHQDGRYHFLDFQSRLIKSCPICGRLYPATPEYFYADNSRSRLKAKCKTCYIKMHIYSYDGQSIKPKERVARSIRSLINQSLKGGKNGWHWETLVGYTLSQLINHLEGQFTEGMNWDNYGKWHIDHIIPISVFNFEKHEDTDFKRCWSLKNLQPLWARDNISKHAKIQGAFQPSLIL